MQKVHGDRAREQTSIRLSRNGSCDACRRKKKRCDGEQPCSRCLRAESECRYRKKRWHLYHDPPRHQHQRQRKKSDRDVARAWEDLANSRPSGLLERRMLPFKRCRLSASPATGLVGMQENAFLSDFFGCVGFLPITDESQIRETMVKIMASTPSQPELALVTDCCGEEGQFDALDVGDTFGTVSAMNQLPGDPSFCTFWCAIAVGALAKGRPVEWVERYSELAREALAVSRSGSPSTGLVKASANLAYLHSFLGDRGKFLESLKLAEHFARPSTHQSSADLRMEMPDLFARWRMVDDDAMRAPETYEEAPLQAGDVFTEGDLYRFVKQSFRVFHQTAYAKARQSCAGDLDQCYPGGAFNKSCQLNDVSPSQVSEAFAEVLRTGSSLEPLRETIDRSRIRAGIGGLLINGPLVIEKAAERDIPATLERSARCVEVYEWYPGLCRYLVGYHLSHMLLASLAAIDDPRSGRIYGRLRGAYNSCRASHAVAIPPQEEWQGMGAICSDLHCRAIGTLVGSRQTKAFSPISANSRHDSAGLTQADRNPHVLTSVVHGERVDVAPGPLPSSWAERTTTREQGPSQDPYGAVGCAGNALASLAFPFCSRSKSSQGIDPDCGRTGVSPRDLASLLRPAGVGGHLQDIAEPEGDEIAAADWLEASYAMLDAIHTS